LLLATSPVIEAAKRAKRSGDGQQKYRKHKELQFEGDRSVDEYLGIPFAEPPLNDKRFMPPQEYENKPTNRSPFQASTPARTCPQDLFQTGIHALDFWNPPKDTISEDCLQLNMWVPANTTGAVLVNLCGGAYWRLGASADIFNGSALAAYSGAIVVNLNFRLGALGFARSKNSSIYGNMGLLDQQMGLQWIKENIKDFGGDPEKVTLMGEQTGASSAQAHLYAKNSTGLFKRIALTSGVLENPWASRSNRFEEKATEMLASLLNCTTTNKNQKVDLACLQKKHYTEILNATATVKKSSGLTFGFPFSLIFKDKEFFDKNITREQPNVQDVDILMGNTKDEGSFFLWYYFNKTANCDLKMKAQPMTGSCSVSESAFNTIVQNVTDIFGKEKSWQDKVKEYYYRSETNRTKVTEKFLADILFDCGLKQFADNITDNKKDGSYVYEFRHRSNEKSTTWPESFGTVHAALIEFLFGRPFRYPDHYDNEKLGKEKEMSQKVMELYGKFAKDGKPADNWEPYKQNDKKVMILNSNFNVSSSSQTYKTSAYGDNCDWLINRFEQEVRMPKKPGKKQQ
uniref:Acetylcholinesterase n=1 Tax=Parastrongyloides trichosuri TaxID=131310 RepID=A0A0N4ZIY4_PARTI